MNYTARLANLRLKTIFYHANSAPEQKATCPTDWTYLQGAEHPSPMWDTVYQPVIVLL
jgi:hypothetical protein